MFAECAVMQKMSERFRLAISKSGISQRELARQLKILASSISGLLAGKNFLAWERMVQAAKILHVSLDWLAYGDGTEDGSIEARLDKRKRTVKEELEYLINIIEKLEKTEKDEIYEFIIHETDKKIRAVVNSRKKHIEIQEEPY